MKIILSRKGFETSNGGDPSPVMPDGRMLSLPIPDKHSPIRYQDIHLQEYNLGKIVSDLTGGRISAPHFAHLDPDLNPESLPRHPEWRPVFGQTGAAQGHLHNQGVQAGDVFLFFGRFRQTAVRDGRFSWKLHSPEFYAFWGWLQIDEVLRIDDVSSSGFEWARYHPHFHRQPDPNNPLYITRDKVQLPNLDPQALPGSGVFQRISGALVMTAPDAAKPSEWALPDWFYPGGGKPPLTYHSNLARWQKSTSGLRLSSAAIGQEFVLDIGDAPAAIPWLKFLLEANAFL